MEGRPIFSADTIELVTRAAQRAGLEPAILLALIEVETGGRTGVMVGGRLEPLIRFEGHYFDRRLSLPQREVARRKGLAAPSAGAVRNPPGQAARWRMLGCAAEIDRRAAYESTSWGMGQVMGAHWSWLGYPSIDALVDEARSGPEGQLRLMLRYIERAGLMEALNHRDWPAFARAYNGPGFARNGYHLKLSLAYRRHARTLATKATGEPVRAVLREGDRSEAVRQLQNLLCALGYAVSVDGAFGPQTRQAVTRFQRDNGLIADGIAGPATAAAMERALPLKRLPQAWWRMVEALWRRLSGKPT